MDDDFEEVILPISNNGGKAEQKIKPSVSMDEEREKGGEEVDEIDKHSTVSVHVSRSSLVSVCVVWYRTFRSFHLILILFAILYSTLVHEHIISAACVRVRVPQ